MTRLLLTSFFTLTLLFLFSSQINAQCVECVPAPPGFGCGPTSVGAQFCIPQPTKVPSCTVTGVCSGLRADGTCDYKKTPRTRTLEISDKTILEIGNMSPRLAVNLISLRATPVDFKTGSISFVDIEIGTKDVSKFLDTKTPQEFFDSVKEQVKISFENKQLPIKYDISLEEIDDTFKLLLKTSDKRVTYSGIEINFKTIKVDDEKVRLEFIGWKFN